MADKKPMAMSDIVPVMSKIKDHKLNGHNYLDLSKIVWLYLRSINMDDHMITTSPTDDSNNNGCEKMFVSSYKSRISLIVR